MKKFKTKEELLQDSINYYWGKPERQCKVPTSTTHCQYSSTETSMGCAIGRVIPVKLSKKLDKKGFGVSSESVFEQLPEWLRAFGQQFLINLQVLHDTDVFKDEDDVRVHRKMNNYVDMSKITFPEI